MDKPKKASSKKNKTVGSSLSSAKGRDVTDSSNKTASTLQAAAAAPSSVATAEKRETEAELKRLREENQQLVELKRRHEAELSALRRSSAEATEFINSLREVNIGSGGKSFSIISIF